MKYKYRKFFSLHNHLMSLLTEQANLFLFKRGLFDELRMEQLKKKYPYWKESMVQNRIAIRNTIEDLQSILNYVEPVTYEQAELIFNS